MGLQSSIAIAGRQSLTFLQHPHLMLGTHKNQILRINEERDVKDLVLAPCSAAFLFSSPACEHQEKTPLSPPFVYLYIYAFHKNP